MYSMGRKKNKFEKKWIQIYKCKKEILLKPYYKIMQNKIFELFDMRFCVWKFLSLKLLE